MVKDIIIRKGPRREEAIVMVVSNQNLSLNLYRTINDGHFKYQAVDNLGIFSRKVRNRTKPFCSEVI